MMQIVFFFVTRLLPILMGSLSLAYVFWAGFEIDLAVLIEEMLKGFDALLLATVGWIGGKIAAYFSSWSWFAGFEMDPNWRHVASLSYLYFIRDFENFRSYGQRVMILASLITGFAAILVFPVLGGLLGAEDSSYAKMFVFGLFPLLGFLFYGLTVTTFGGFVSRSEINRKRGLTMTFWDYVLSRYLRWVVRFVTGVALLAVLIRPMSTFVDTTLPTTMVLLVLWIVLAVEWLSRGIPQAVSEARTQNLPLAKALKASGNVNLGFNMLAAVAGGLTTIAFGLLI
jgi:diacylglycerol kinase